jgi:transposase InsO family protein
MVGPVAKREAVAHLRNVLQISERRACILVAADRKMIRYRSRRPPDVELRARLRDLANQRRRFGYRRLFILLREQGEPSGINRIYRLYREEGLTVRKRKARRKAIGTRTRRSCSRPRSTRAGRSTSSMTSSPRAGASASSTLSMM